MNKIVVRFKSYWANLKTMAKGFAKHRKAEGFLDVLIKILITVIIGAALLALLRIAIPDLFQNIIDKIKSVFVV